MAYRGARVTVLQVKRDIHLLMEKFPKLEVIVSRFTDTFTDTGAHARTQRKVYEGPALVRPASGDVEGYGLGTVENQSLVILINGLFDMAQGDLVTINDGREYEVDFPPRHFNAFTVLNLGQRSQVTQPRQG